MWVIVWVWKFTFFNSLKLKRKINKLAEKVGFEPTVALLELRVFSKDLVSATHPLLRNEKLMS